MLNGNNWPGGWRLFYNHDNGKTVIGPLFIRDIETVIFQKRFNIDIIIVQLYNKKKYY